MSEIGLEQTYLFSLWPLNASNILSYQSCMSTCQPPKGLWRCLTNGLSTGCRCMRGMESHSFWVSCFVVLLSQYNVAFWHRSTQDNCLMSMWKQIKVQPILYTYPSPYFALSPTMSMNGAVLGPETALVLEYNKVVPIRGWRQRGFPLLSHPTPTKMLL